MSKQQNKKTIDLDRRLSEIIRSQTGAVPEDPWFRRKILNRLPDHRRLLFSFPEVVAVVIAALVLGFTLLRETRLLLSSPDPATFDFTLLAATLALCLGLTLYVAAGLLRRV
ncbi:MAG: hypothetical protein NC336_00530 [Clostridium sp.]|nr:hypothetical protein [Clostridium sp.]